MVERVRRSTSTERCRPFGVRFFGDRDTFGSGSLSNHRFSPGSAVREQYRRLWPPEERVLTATLLALVGRDARSVVDVRVPLDRIGVPRREPSPGFRTGQPVVVRSFALAAPSKQPPKHRFSSSPFFPLRSHSSLVTTSDDRYGSSCIDTPAIGTLFRPERSHANRTLPFPGFGGQRFARVPRGPHGHHLRKAGTRAAQPSVSSLSATPMRITTTPSIVATGGIGTNRRTIPARITRLDARTM